MRYLPFAKIASAVKGPTLLPQGGNLITMRTPSRCKNLCAAADRGDRLVCYGTITS